MNKKILLKYFQLIFVICITGSMILISSETNIFIHILAILILCISAIIISDFDFFHPYFWYSVIFTLYSISYPILYKFSIIIQFGYTKELMILQWMALSVFLFVVSPKKLPKYINFKVSQSSNFNKVTVNIFCFLLLITSFYIYRSDYSNKGDIYADNNIFLTGTFSLALVLTIIYMYQFVNHLMKKNSIDKKLIFKVACSIMFLSIFSGERDILFRFLVVSILMLYAFKKVRNIHLLLLVPLFIVALPLSHFYKYFFLTKETSSEGSFNLTSIFFAFLNGEFVSASKNLQILLNSEYTNGLFGGYTILNDIIRIFIPTGFTSVGWFNDTFYPHVKTTSYGFTLIGQGYVNWGYIGVIVIFVFIALFIRILYLKSNKNIYYFVIYIYTIPLYMYAIRADVASIFSPFVKHLLLSMLIIYLTESIFGKKNIPILVKEKKTM